MWVIFTYVYNSILIIFIAAHLLVGAILAFGVGVYFGIYLCQNYELPRINEPHKLWERFVKFTEQYRKKNTSRGTPSSSNRISIISIITAEDESEQETAITSEAETIAVADVPVPVIEESDKTK